MEDKSKQIDEQVSVPELGSGAMLAAARKQQNRSIEEIADELNLSQTQIRTIELDQSEGLPEPTYVRGYIRSYAKLLGLNAEEVLDHYLNKNWQKSANLDDMPRGIGDGDSSEPSNFSPARVIVFLVIMGLLGFFWFSGSLDGLLGNADNAQNQLQNTSPALNQESSTPEAVSSSAVGVSQDQEADQALDAENTEQLADTGADSDSNDTEPTAVPEVVSPSNETRVVINFTDTSWVDIRDEQQNRLAYRSYPAGETLDVAAQGVLSVLIGNAKGVQMSVNGQPYDLRQHTSGVYAKFSVGVPKE